MNSLGGKHILTLHRYSFKKPQKPKPARWLNSQVKTIQYCKEEQGLVGRKLVEYEQQPHHGRVVHAVTPAIPG